ncbi:LysR family transcriptional regulator [Cytobacillus sp. Hm23]
MVTIVQLEIFLTVTETNNFTKAGEIVGLSQSAVSHSISNLEESLGFKLFSRDRSGIKITKNGERMQNYAKKILIEIKQMNEEIVKINSGNSKKIRIGFLNHTINEFFLSRLKKFQQNFPVIDIEIWEGSHEEVVNWISNETIDLGTVFLPVNNTTLDVSILKKDGYFLVLPHDHPLCQESEPSLDKIISEPIILLQEGENGPMSRLINQSNIALNKQFMVNNVNSIINMVRCGIGIGIIQELMIPNTNIVYTAPFHLSLHRTIGIAIKASKSIPTTILKLREILIN